MEDKAYKIVNGEHIILGTCYYPEHWPEELWEDDLRRMLDTGIEVIRIAEFAWNKVEPREGEFNYEFFDRFLDIAEKVGMKVIFCTPTATPPAWLTNKYPEVLNADIDGNLYYHGARRHYNYNSTVYKELSARITRVFAEHYAKRECIIGWQLDNEINCEKDVFYSESDVKAFRQYVKDKYVSLDSLNEAWGTVFWNQTYSSWEEIDVPRKTYSDSINPHRVLDYYRFISKSARAFVKLQSDIIREYLKPTDFITTNGMFKHLNNHKMTEESLDFYTYDSYPNFSYGFHSSQKLKGDLKDRKWSRNLSEVRSISPIFGIMEQQSGANGWTTALGSCSPRPGQITLWTMQSIAHGADYISYFRWRTCTYGTEMYWHGILDYSGRDNERLREIAQIHTKLKKIQEIAGAVYEAEVGIIKDYDNIFDAEVDKWHQGVDEQSQKALFEALQLTHTPFDYVYFTDKLTVEELKKYKVIFYPHPFIINQKRAAILQDYVKQGGTLVVGCRSAYKDMTGKCVMDLLPGLLADVTGTDVFEYSLIAPDIDSVTIDWDGTLLQANVFTDRLRANSLQAKVEGVYTSEHFAGDGALISNTYGEGKAYYYGTAFNFDSAKTFLAKLNVISPYESIISLPEGCEIAVRTKNNKKYMFVLNYSRDVVEIELHDTVVNMYTGTEISGKQSLQGYGTMVLSLSTKR